jgi:hypothetical protein
MNFPIFQRVYNNGEKKAPRIYASKQKISIKNFSSVQEEEFPHGFS